MASGWGPESFLVPGKWTLLKTAARNKAVCHTPLWEHKDKLLCSEISNASLHFHKTKHKLLWLAPEAPFPIIALYALPHTLHPRHIILCKLPWHSPRALYLHVPAQEDSLGCPPPLPLLFFFFNVSKLSFSFTSQLNVSPLWSLLQMPHTQRITPSCVLQWQSVPLFKRCSEYRKHIYAISPCREHGVPRIQ